MALRADLVLYALALIIPLFVLFEHFTDTDTDTDTEPERGAAERTSKSSSQENSTSATTMMQPARTDLPPPKDDPFTQEELKAFDGTNPDQPIYVAIKGTPYFSRRAVPALDTTDAGTVFDVTRKRDTYGKGGSYSLFAGKDASRALGLSSLKPEDAVPDWSTLEEKDRKTLDDWHSFFTCVLSLPLSLSSADDLLGVRKRYAVVGRVVDLPAAVANL